MSNLRPNDTIDECLLTDEHKYVYSKVFSITVLVLNYIWLYDKRRYKKSISFDFIFQGLND